MRNKKFLFLYLFFFVQLSATYQLQNSAQAYAYCMRNTNSFIAIVWPLAQGHDAKIEEIMRKFGGTIAYRKNHLLTPKTAYKLLKEAHYNAGIKDMKEHLNWYFPKDTYKHPARIFVINFENTEKATACKYAIRKLLFPKLQYRSVHINDFHSETIALAKFFFT